MPKQEARVLRDTFPASIEVPKPILPRKEAPKTDPSPRLASDVQEELSRLPSDFDPYNEKVFAERYPRLDAILNGQQAWGVDCHQYVFRSLGDYGYKHPALHDAALHRATSFPLHIRRKDYDMSTLFQEDVYQDTKARMATPAGERFLAFQREFTRAFLDQAKQDKRDVVSSLDGTVTAQKNGVESYSHALKTAHRLVEMQLAEVLSADKRFPRVLEISFEHSDGSMRDIHATIILAPIEGSERDYWVVERSEIASPVEIRKLSEVVEKYNDVSLYPPQEAQEGKLHFSLVKSEQAVLDKMQKK